MSEIEIWDDEDVNSDYVLVFDGDWDFLKDSIEQELVIKPKAVFVVPEKHKENAELFLYYLSVKYGFKLSNEFLEKEQLYFVRTLEQCLKGEDNFEIKLDSKPNVLHRIEIFVEIINSIYAFRSELLRSSIYSRHRNVSFDFTWWHQKNLMHERLKYISTSRKQALYETDFGRKISSYIDNISSVFSELSSGTDDNQLIIMSAFCFASSIYNLRKGEENKSILLLHRSLDFFFLSIASIEFLLRKGVDGLEYSSCRKDVNLSTTKSMLESSSRINISEEDSKKVDRINFIRNRLILTHSVYSISSDEVEIFISEIRVILKKLDGDSGKWVGYLRMFIAKPVIGIGDVFDFEDSFDSYIRKVAFE